MPLETLGRLRRAWNQSALSRRNRIGGGLRLDGRPFVENLGTLNIGRNFDLSSQPVQSHLVVGPSARLEIGDDVSIAYGASISANLSVSIGDGVKIGPFSMVLDSDFHEVGDHGAAGRSAPIVIGPGVRIGSRVTLLRGARIGEGGVVMAGSVVGDVVPPHTRVAGIPARSAAISREVLEPEDTASVVATVQALVRSALNLTEIPALNQGPAQIAQWDSLAALKIILALEDHFHIAVDDNDMRPAANVGDLATVVERALSRQP
jgi:maltose O-acetyltransferase